MICFLLQFGIDLFQVILIEIMLRFFGDDISQHQHGDNVRDAHCGIEDVSHRPDGSFRHHGTDEDDDDPQDLIDADRFLAEKILDAVFTVIAPAKDRGVGKRDDAECQQRLTQIRDLVEAR